MRTARVVSFLFAVGQALACAWQEPDASEPPPKKAPAIEAVTEERVVAAYADARAACKEVLGVDLDSLPPLKMVAARELGEAVTAENLPVISLREPDQKKAQRAAAAAGRQFAQVAYAKYAWSTKSFLVVAKNWERFARALCRPELTADNALRAVMVHELCHAIDDRKFDIGKCLLTANTVEAVDAFSAVIEGHAQLVARRVCRVRGWSDGFDAFTGVIGAIPEGAADGEAMMLQLRAAAAALSTAYVDGERFVAAIVEARPETGVHDVFQAPPKDGDTVLHPAWYLDPKSRPAVLHDPEPAIDAFVARFDADVWTATRTNPTPKQLATGLTMLPKEDADALVASMRALRYAQVAPTKAPQSKLCYAIVMEFDGESSARRWVEISDVVSKKKDETMKTGAVRILSSSTRALDEGPVRGFLQRKTMTAGSSEFDVVSIDAWRGRLVVETLYSGEPPSDEEHVRLVDELLSAVRKR